MGLQKGILLRFRLKIINFSIKFFEIQSKLDLTHSPHSYQDSHIWLMTNRRGNPSFLVWYNIINRGGWQERVRINPLDITLMRIIINNLVENY